MDFFDRYVDLCIKKGISPSRAAVEIGITKTAVSNWKSRSTKPTDANLHKIADYFGVSPDYLLGKEEKNLVNQDEELTEYLQELKNREEMRLLFSVSKTCTKEQVEQAVRIIEALRGS